MFRVVAALALATLSGCRGEAARPVYPLGDEPLPAASERCFRERFEVDGRSREMRLRLRMEPEAGRIVQHVAEHGGPSVVTWRTVMDVESERFTSVETGPEGEARGEGTLTGRRWAWSAWTGVTQRAGGVADQVAVSFPRDGMIVEVERRGPDGAVASTSRRRYVAIACVTFGAAPIEALEPARPPAATAP
jgi:hypothetical protein